ncbi:hypothetical protein Droror1_Dr00010045 [Drosera rotundifolia]
MQLQPTLVEEKCSIILHDLLIDVLYWLPVRSLIRFQCICRSWRDLIWSRSFALEHYDQNAWRNKEILLLHDFVTAPTYDTHPYGFVGHPIFLKPVLVDHGQLRSIFVCNGVICLLISRNIMENVVLWNPAINEYSILP